MTEKKNNSFSGHFIELRSRLIKSLLFIFVVFVISYTFAQEIYNFLIDPYANAVKNSGTNRRLIFTALHETFLTYLKVAFFCAIFFGSPFFLIQIWKFIAPGLYSNEKSFIALFNFYADIIFIRRITRLLLSDAISYKFFLSFETTSQQHLYLLNLRQKLTNIYH